MKAMILDAAHAPFRLADLEKPIPAAGQVLVRIHASGVTVLDTKIRAGLAGHARQPLPAILGMEMAGVIEQLGEGVSRFQIGDEICGMAGGIGGIQGSMAEYAVADAALLARKPANLSMREAASLPLNVITAWEGLIDRAKLQPGQRVLVQGGAGGVGHIALQLAKAFGAEISGTGGSAESLAHIASLGATPIDYRHEELAGRDFEVVYDTAGGASLDASFAAVARFGHVVSALGWGTHALAPLSFKAATYSGVFTLLPLLTGIGGEHHGEILEQAAKLVEAGKIRPRLDPRRFALTDADAAHQAVTDKSAKGKVVIEIR